MRKIQSTERENSENSTRRVDDVMMMIHALFLSLSGDWGTASSYGIACVEPFFDGY